VKIHLLPKEFAMQKVENGLFVSVDYTGTLASGEIFDSSKSRGAGAAPHPMDAVAVIPATANRESA
jgi:FKBP-type peptidyl-prolyl cis-trans isomerase